MTAYSSSYRYEYDQLSWRRVLPQLEHLRRFEGMPRGNKLTIKQDASIRVYKEAPGFRAAPPPDRGGQLVARKTGISSTRPALHYGWIFYPRGAPGVARPPGDPPKTAVIAG